MVEKAQQKLTELGYAPGPADGKMGKKTEDAIKIFQQDNTLTVTGTLTEETLIQLELRPQQEEAQQEAQEPPEPQESQEPETPKTTMIQTGQPLSIANECHAQMGELSQTDEAKIQEITVLLDAGEDFKVLAELYNFLETNPANKYNARPLIQNILLSIAEKQFEVNLTGEDESYKEKAFKLTDYYILYFSKISFI